jgi:DNA-binding IclR family transcriptional regulator
MVTAHEEYVEGVQEYALPIRDSRGIVASIGVSGGALSARRAREAQSALLDAHAHLTRLVREP